MLKFDEKGYLTPYDIIKTDIEQFKQTFVFNERREKIFRNYMIFNDLLNEMPVGSFYQWLNGSFVTRKTYPNDLDFINFVSSDFYFKFEYEIRSLRKMFDKLDCYFVAVYPKEHRLYVRTQLDMLEWQHDFCTNRVSSIFQVKTNKKGFLQINFD